MGKNNRRDKLMNLLIRSYKLLTADMRWLADTASFGNADKMYIAEVRQQRYATVDKSSGRILMTVHIQSYKLLMADMRLQVTLVEVAVCSL